MESAAPINTTPFAQQFEQLRDELLAKLASSAPVPPEFFKNTPEEFQVNSIKDFYDKFPMGRHHLPPLRLMEDAKQWIDHICTYGLDKDIVVAILSLHSITELNEKERSALTCTGPTIRLVKFLALQKEFKPMDVGSAFFALRHMACGAFEKQYRTRTQYNPEKVSLMFPASSKISGPVISTASIENWTLEPEEVTAGASSTLASASNGAKPYYDPKKMHRLFKEWPGFEGRIRGIMIRLMEPLEWNEEVVLELKLAHALTDEDFAKLGKVKFLTLKQTDFSVDPVTGKFKNKGKPDDGPGNRVDWEKIYNDGSSLTHRVHLCFADKRDYMILRDGCVYIEQKDLPTVAENFYVFMVQEELREMAKSLSTCAPRFHFDTLPPLYNGLLFTYDYDLRFYMDVAELLKSERHLIVSRNNQASRANVELSCTMAKLWATVNKLPMCLRVILLRFKARNRDVKLNHAQRNLFITLMCHAGVSEKDMVLFFETYYRGNDVCLGTEEMKVTIRNTYRAATRPISPLLAPGCNKLQEYNMCPWTQHTKVQGASAAIADIEDSVKLLHVGFKDYPYVTDELKDRVPGAANPFLLKSTTAIEKCRMHVQLCMEPQAVQPRLGFKSPLAALRAIPALCKPPK